MKIFLLSLLASVIHVYAEHPVSLTEQKPVSITKCPDGAYLVDFGKVAFANIQLSPPESTTEELTIHFGEAFDKNVRRINRKPPGTVRYNLAKIKLAGAKSIIVAPPADARNTETKTDKHPPAILTPPEWGVILPFRWVEIEGWPGDLKPEHITRRAAFATAWNDEDSRFTSSNDTLNKIWNLCKYSIQATTFAGVYVDGDRERIPYEADAYINQLCHYYTSFDSDFARRSYDYLINYGTWPTEWAPHMVFIAHADWMRNGDAKWLAARYEKLKTKTLLERAGLDGLIKSTKKHMTKGDIVDWPHTERDGYVFTHTNTVVNAFHIKALRDMGDIAEAIGKMDEAKHFRTLAAQKLVTFQKNLFNEAKGNYRDGIGTDHSSQHANFFPLAFGLVPQDKKDGVIRFISNKGMNCSVYASQYFMEALFQNGADAEAMNLILADHDRSWKHMLNTGTTITYEAWDQKYKPNQDWNHAWGAAPANLLPRFVLGAQALKPGWGKALIRPHIAKLSSASGKIPTPKGAILVDWKNKETFTISITLPDGMTAQVELPATPGSQGVSVNGTPAKAVRKMNRWVLEQEISGKVNLTVTK